MNFTLNDRLARALCVSSLGLVSFGGCSADATNVPGSGANGGVECGEGTVLKDEVCVPESDISCGEGTVLKGGACVPESEVDCGEGTVLNDGTCTPECADGELLKDGACVPETECGPGTVVIDGECIPNDGKAPSAITDLNIGSDGSDLVVSWTNPADSDFAGALLLRQARLPILTDNGPEQFVNYKVGDAVEGVEVIHVSEATATSFTDTTAILGMRYSYAAIGFDAARNYGPSVRVIGVEPLAVQTAQIEIADPGGTPTAVVKTAPSTFGLTVSDVTVVAGKMSLKLTVKNNFGLTVVTPKILLDQTSQGAASEPAGTIGSSSYWRFEGFFGSPGSGEPDMQQTLLGIAEGDEASQIISVDGIDGMVNPVVLDVTIGRDPIVGFSLHDYDDQDAIFAQFYDQGAHSFVSTLPKTAGSANSGSDERSACGSAIISADNRWFYCGSSHSASVKIYDIAEMGSSNSSTIIEVPIHRDQTVNDTATLSLLEDTTAFVRTLALSPDDKTLYATVGYAGRSDMDADRADGLDVIRLDVSNPMAPVADNNKRVVLNNSNGYATSFGAALSPNGKWFAVSGYVTKTLHFIDTTTMTEVDTDSVASGTQPLDMSSYSGEPGQMVWRGNTGLAVAVGYGQRILFVNVAKDYAIHSIRDVDAYGEPQTLGFDLQGRLWVLQQTSYVANINDKLKNVLSVITPAEEGLPFSSTVTAVPFLKAQVEANRTVGLWLSSDHSRVIASTNGQNAVVREFSAATLLAVPDVGEQPAPYVAGQVQDDYGHWTTGTSL